MKKILILLFFFFITNCSKPKTVLICGDHICVNNAEAENYFERNLSIEVRIIDRKKKNEIDLIELNLNEDFKNDRKITLSSKKISENKLKELSSKEVSEIKKNLRNNKNEQKIVKKVLKNEKKLRENKIVKKNKFKENNDKNSKKIVNKKIKEAVDVCKILKKCSIDEISKYLLKEGKKKSFPDITARQ